MMHISAFAIVCEFRVKNNTWLCAMEIAFLKCDVYRL